MATRERNEGEKGLFDQDPFVEQLRPDPSAPPSDVVVLEGLAGKSDREGWARLYFNRTLTYYAEFRREDIVFTEAIPPDQAPMVGLKATRVGIKKDAVIEYTRSTRAKAGDEFDLDVQLEAGSQRGAQPNSPFSLFPGRGCGGTFRTDCEQATCETCQTRCDQPTCPKTQCQTCQTCQTCPGQTCQGTCRTCTNCLNCVFSGHGTCLTCQTCQTCPDQGTCQTCHGTCRTCDTCNPHVFTCGGGRCL